MNYPKTWEDLAPEEKMWLCRRVRHEDPDRSCRGLLTLREKRLWANCREELQNRPSVWRHVPPEHSDDPLHMALHAKNRRAAREMLLRRPALDLEQASRYAVLTLQWAPDLLEMVLDRAPAGELFGSTVVAFPKKDHREHRRSADLSEDFLYLTGTLPILCAALDAPASLEILLRRGYTPYYDFKTLRWVLAAHHLSQKPPPHRWPANIPSGPEVTVGGLLHQNAGPDPDAMAAAVFRNSRRCLAMLLAFTGGQLTPQARHALAADVQYDGARCSKEIFPLLRSLLGESFEEQITLADYGDRVAPRQELYLRCLLKAPELPPDLPEKFIQELDRVLPASPSREWLKLCRALLVQSDFSCQLHRLLCRYQGETIQRWQPLLCSMDLTLNRNWFAPTNTMAQRDIQALSYTFRRFSPAPKDHLSPLARAVLDAYRWQTNGLPQLFQSPLLLDMLRDEAPTFLLAHLRENGRVSSTHIQTLRVLLWPQGHLEQPDYEL